ncbi:MAG: tRNA (adenosine(37)-N6)-threonylcarbamoyltransferase complex dimerization subunit type 1 TsaB [Burkholderiaceae bacterium]|jgi:tRNA threonylcarbamoyladenosine biosynthesis protein TsaB|nr:tRNA (adenosine(37)-N6)-threonylcarbamoyltransferase complex dimerization subunit type 1 TsaB [Burkholderiaceae bacterium]
MPTILSLDTSSDIASVALMRDGDLFERASADIRMHSQAVLPMVEALLREGKVTVRDCDAIAFGCGPGSFTGLRTACGVAQGLAFGAGLPLVPIVGLCAMAQGCYEKTGEQDVLAVLDARMGEVYWAQYRYDNGDWHAVREPALSRASEIMALGSPAICGNALRIYADALPHVSCAVICPEIVPHASAIAQLARKAFSRGETVSASRADSLYLRDKVAYTTEENRLMKVKQAC